MNKTKKTKKKEPRFFELWKEENRANLLEWWQSLAEATGPRAQLRRARSPEEALLHPQTHRLTWVLPWASPEAAATIAGILAHVKLGKHDDSSIGQKLARSSTPGGPPLFSENRFRQLLASRDWYELYRNLRRAVQALDGNVNPLLLADLVLSWDREFHWKKTVSPSRSLKFRLSRDYYNELK